MTCQPSQYIMGLLIAGTLYGKINLGTRFVAVINRGEGGPRSVGMPDTGLEAIVQNCRTSSIKNMVGISPEWWDRAILQLSIREQVTEAPTFDYKLSIKSETRTAGSTIAILQIFYGRGGSRFGEGQTPSLPLHYPLHLPV